MLNSFLAFKSLHSLSKLSNLDFFINLRILKTFDRVNINRLKNIFFKFLDDSFVWDEIQKLLMYGFIDFSNDYIYLKKDLFHNNLLSIFLFEIYFSELDIYVLNLNFLINSSKTFFFKVNPDVFTQLLFFNTNLIPLKLEKFLFSSISLKQFFFYRFNTIRKLFFYKSFFFTFSRSFFFKRYKDQCLVGIQGSKSLVSFLNNKLFFFIRTNLRMDFSDFRILSKFDKSVFFLGFKIELKILNNASNKSHFLSFLKRSFNLSLLSRLENFRKNLIKLSLKRFNSELFFQSFMLLNVKDWKTSKFYEKKFWLLIFQLESIRSFQFYKLLITNDLICLIPNSQFFAIYFNNSFFYHKYFFNYYLHKSKKIIKNILTSFFPPIRSSFFSIDLKVNLYLIELKKRMLFYYYFFDFNVKDSFFKQRIVKKSSRFSGSLYTTSNNIVILFPVNYIYSRFRDLGFFHPLKFRPVSNSKLIFLKDILIIKIYGYLAYSILFWYNISDNFFKVKVFIDFLRQSCLLTLCRKHNKNKNWSFNIYTSNVILLRGLFISNSFFPSKKYLVKLRKNTLNESSFFLFDEKFFFGL